MNSKKAGIWFVTALFWSLCAILWALTSNSYAVSDPSYATMFGRGAILLALVAMFFMVGAGRFYTFSMKDDECPKF